MVFSLPPELCTEIFKNLDVGSLYSSTLVNRTWCRNAVTLLWQNPLEWVYYGGRRFKTISVMKTYLSCLPEKSKSRLYNAGINLTIEFSSRPTFEYTSFLNSLNYMTVIKSIDYLLSLGVEKRKVVGDNSRLIFTELCELFFIQCKSLRSLEYREADNGNYIDLPVLHEADTFFANLQRFCYREKIPPELADVISQKSSALVSLEAHQGIDGENVIRLMNNKLRLRELTITGFNDIPKIDSVLLKHSKNLRRVNIRGRLNKSLKVFSQFTNLEELSLIYSLPEIPDGLSLNLILAYSQAKTQHSLVRLVETRIITIQSRNQSKYSDGNQSVLSHRQISRKSGTTKIVDVQRSAVAISYAIQVQILRNYLENRLQCSLPSQTRRPEIFDNFLNSNLTKLTKLEINLKDQCIQNFIYLIQNTQGSLRIVNLIVSNPVDPENSSKLFTTIINNCPKLVEFSLEIPNESISEIPMLFEKCPFLEEIYLLGNPIERADISELLLYDLVSIIPFNLKILSLGLFFWTYTKEAINNFMKGCETRLRKKPYDFIVGDNLSDDVKDVLEFHKISGLINLVKGNN
ncbi:8842_t:CDS:2 [Acaulospora morrowiae]|uniref:8842_t:CDS:1 n=1 Tax=Acaulospora morrowiae TaxID=94023 RepID=A0A9N9G0R9_9GLOM|nr:8842_t:CDS:2 [Acaulospora morrowiae]